MYSALASQMLAHADEDQSTSKMASPPSLASEDDASSSPALKSLSSSSTSSSTDAVPPPPTLQSVSSSCRWAKQMLNSGSNHSLLVDKFHKGSTRLAETSVVCHGTDADPINILCMDGGGMKGYSHAAVMGELQRMMGRNCDLMQFFDMACGTSVGGIAALMQGYHGTNKGFLKDSKFLLDKIRRESFQRFSLWNLLRRGSLTSGEDKIAHIVEEYYGNLPLHNPGGLKAFALCTVQEENHDGSAKFEPFVLRSYDLPEKKRSLKDDDDDEFDFEVDGTHEVLLWEAMAATSAAPVLTDRVDLELNGKKRRVADGCLMSNAPVAIAIAEARRLWPKRPLGIILSLGLGDRDNELVARVIKTAKEVDSPDLEHLRLVPPIKEFATSETDPERIKELQAVAVKHVQENEKELKSLLSKLQSSGSRTRANGSKSCTRRKSRRMSAWLARDPVQELAKGRRCSAFRRSSRLATPTTSNSRGSLCLVRNIGGGGAPNGFQDFWEAAENDPELKNAMRDSWVTDGSVADCSERSKQAMKDRARPNLLRCIMFVALLVLLSFSSPPSLPTVLQQIFLHNDAANSNDAIDDNNSSPLAPQDSERDRAHQTVLDIGKIQSDLQDKPGWLSASHETVDGQQCSVSAHGSERKI